MHPVQCVLESQRGLPLGCTPSPWCSCSLCCPWDVMHGRSVSVLALHFVYCVWLHVLLAASLPVEPCWAEGQTPDLAPFLWTSSLHRCSGLQPRTLLQYCPGKDNQGRGGVRAMWLYKTNLGLRFSFWSIWVKIFYDESFETVLMKDKFVWWYHASIYCTYNNLLDYVHKMNSHPNTKRPTSISQNLFHQAPVANITCAERKQVEIRQRKIKEPAHSHVVFKVNPPVQHRQRGRRW